MSTTTETVTIPDWTSIIAEEQAAIRKENAEKEGVHRREQEEKCARNARRNMLLKQSLSGVQGVLADILKVKEVRDLLDTAFPNLPFPSVALCEGPFGNGEHKRAILCLARTNTPETFTIEFRDSTPGSLTRNWTIHSDVFYELPDNFLFELGQLVHSEQLVRRVVRALYPYLPERTENI